jgi:hypothetical protein
MRNYLAVLFASGVLALAACAVTAPGPDPEAIARDAQKVVDPGQLVALAGGEASAARLADRAAQRGYRVESRDALPDLDLVLLTFRMPPGTEAPAAIEELERLEPGVTVGLNHAYAPGPEGGAPGGPRLYVNALLDWPTGGCPAQQPIGVIDTGLDAGAALGAATVTSQGFAGDPSAAGTAHGTAVAELLAGPGRLQNVHIFQAAAVGDVPGADPAAGVDDIMRAVSWLNSSGVRLVNVSLAGPYNKILDRGLRAAAERGLIIVAAAGNDGPSSPPRYPAAFDFVIAVTAVDASLEPYARAPRGDYIDFAAPGVDVFVPVGGEGRYLSGTSIAAPFVTTLIAADPASASLTSVGAVRAHLARATVDLGAPGPDETFGAGLPTAPPPCRAPANIEAASS